MKRHGVRPELFTDEMIMNWHATGRIPELEKRCGGKNTPFDIEMHKKYSGKR